ncbi:MAG: T9SS type A sorting domain-containing protein [Bacteroidales bacterium]|nr:T9SS type A sorting domain-containing protein [Bacteroidales bacterium]
MKNFILVVAAFWLSLSLSAQGLTNPLAMHADSSAFVGWVTHADIVRGYVKISDTTFTYTDNASGVTSNHAFFGTVDNCYGPANGQFISLGDGGYITLQFERPIANGEGHDFAVFENALIPNAVPNQDSIVFYELAFVEVSSNGVDFVRFPAVSHVQTETQVGGFGYENSNLLTNLAGVFPVFYGYPFDLAELADEPNIDIYNITHIRLVDVVGSIDPQYGTYDSEGNIINDPFPTPFHSCGFDLDAVGVIHYQTIHTITASAAENGTISPSGEITVYGGSNKAFTITPNEGYRIESVIVDAGTENERDVTENLVDGVYTFANIDADHTINATFRQIVRVEISTNEGGSVSPDIQYVDFGSDFTFYVEPDNCHVIASVTVNDEEVVLDNNSFTITNVTEVQTINVTFSLIIYDIIITETENGTISPSGENGVVAANCGEDYSFTIIPDSGFMIHAVLVDGDSIGTMSSYSFQSISGNHTIGAIFDSIPEGQVIVVVNANEGGSVEPFGTQAIDYGANFTFSTNPDDCYEVKSVLVNDNEIELENNSYTIENVTEELIINVTFGLINYNITFDAGEHGTISPNGENGVVSVICGDNISFTITPDEQYKIESVVVDGVDVIESVEDGIYAFENVRDNHSISVTFTENNSVDEIIGASIAVFPNPNNGMFSIDFGGIEGKATFQLINARGMFVDSREFNVTDGERIDFDYNNLHSGVYFVRIITPDKVYIEQFIVE